MTKRFKVGDYVIELEAGHVSGKIIKVHTEDVDYKVHPSRERGRSAYEIKRKDRAHRDTKGRALIKRAHEKRAR